jgi:hypothetical protein
MTAPEDAAKLEQLVADQPTPIRAIHERLHALLHELMPDAVERVDLPDRVLAFGTSEKLRDVWFALIAHKAHVNVQLADGVDLDDPDALVEGTGKRIRHVKVRDPDDADRPALRRLMEQQIRLRS